MSYIQESPLGSDYRSPVNTLFPGEDSEDISDDLRPKYIAERLAASQARFRSGTVGRGVPAREDASGPAVAPRYDIPVPGQEANIPKDLLSAVLAMSQGGPEAGDPMAAAGTPLPEQPAPESELQRAYGAKRKEMIESLSGSPYGNPWGGTPDSAPVTKENFISALQGIRAGAKDFGRGALEAPLAVAGGLRDFLQDGIDIIYGGGQKLREITQDTFLGNFLSKTLVVDKGGLRFMDSMPDEAVPELPQINDPESQTGKMLRRITEFSATVLPISRGVKAVGTGINAARTAAGKAAWKASGLGASMAVNASEGAIADMIITKEADATLSTLIQESPALANPITEFLSVDSNSSLAETKFKAALEGMVLGAAGDVLFAGLRKFKQARQAPSAGDVAVSKSIDSLEEDIGSYLEQVKVKSKDASAETMIAVDKAWQTLENLPTQLRKLEETGAAQGTTLNELETSLKDSFSTIQEHFGEIKGSDKISKTISDVQDMSKTLDVYLERSLAYHNSLTSRLGSPDAPVYTTSGGLNIAALKSTEDIKKVLQTSHDFMGTTRADNPDIDWNKVTEQLTASCGNKKLGEGWTGQEMLNAQNLLGTLSDKLIEIASVAQVSRSDADKVAFAHTLLLQNAVQQQVTSGRSVAGQVLRMTQNTFGGVNSSQAMARDLVKRLENTQLAAIAQDADKLQALIDAGGPVGEMGAGIKQSGDRLGKAVESSKDAYNALTKNTTVDLDKLMDTFAMLKDPEQVSSLVSKVDRFTNMQAFVYWRTAQLLTSPKTHIVNITSNILNAMIQVPERFLASHMRTKNPAEGVAKGEWAALAIGQVHGTIDALRLCRKWRQAADEGRIAGTHEATQKYANRTLNRDSAPQLGVMADYLGKVADIPFRALGVEDEFFRTIASRAELQALAYRRAKKLGMEDSTEIATFMHEIIDNPPKEILAQTKDFADYSTFQQAMDGTGKGFHELVESAPWMRLICPFTKTPVNVFRSTLERTPLAPLFIEYKQAVAKGGASEQLARARHALGSGTTMAVGALSAAGFITGKAPTDPGTRELWKAEGIQEYSFKVGDTWYDYRQFEPIGTVIGIAADANNIAAHMNDPKHAEDHMRDFGLVMGNILNSKTYLSGVSGFLDALMSPTAKQDIPTFFRDTLLSAAPLNRFGAWTNQVLDGQVRDTTAWIDKLYSQIPGFSEAIPPRVDIWGEPIPVKSGVGPDAFSPMAFSEMKGDPLTRVLLEKGAGITMPQRSITFGGHGATGIPLEPEEYYDYCTMSGQGTREILVRYTKQFEKANPFMVRKTVAAIVNSQRELAREELLEKYPRLRDVVEAARDTYLQEMNASPEAQAGTDLQFL